MSAIQTPIIADGAILGRYRLTKQLGSGAFGTVWSARDERLDRDVAVKILPRERVNHQRFEREARAAARLQHPAIVTLYEAAVDDEGAYLVSELVRGRTLDYLLERGKLSDREILEIGIGLCEALDHAHYQGVIHRDVKPSNILVAGRASAAGSRAKLTDFGVAHVVGGDALTRTGDVIGTLAYMAPEQAEGREVSPSSDLYSLALVLYEALTGVNPLGHSGHGRRGRRLAGFVPPIRRQRRDLSRELGAGIDQALRPRPVERGTLAELRAAMLSALDGAGEIRGIVGGWHGYDEPDVDELPGPEWQEPQNADGSPRITFEEPTGRMGGAHAPQAQDRLAGLPDWLPVGANAAGAGLGAAWLCTHLLHVEPLAPPAVGLIVAVMALIVPQIATLLTAVALGVVGMAGAFPAVAGHLGRNWWRRALLGALGYVCLLAISTQTHHNLYWLPPHVNLRALGHDHGLAGIGVWAAAAALAPQALARRWPTLTVILSAIWAAVTVSAVQALGTTPLNDPVAGGVLAFLIVALPALTLLVAEVSAERS